MSGWFNIKHSAEYMDVGERTVRELIKLGHLPCSRPHIGTTLIKKEWMDDYLESCKKTNDTDALVDKIVREVVDGKHGS